MSFPLPSNPQLVAPADIYSAVHAFVKAYALPALPDDQIFRGWQNRGYLPSTNNEYAVITIIAHERKGTNVETFAATDANPAGVLTSAELVLCRVQVDCYSDNDDEARRRAQNLETAARSSIGPQFFNQYGMSCNFASNARDLSIVNGSKQFVKRWMVELNLSFTSAFSVDLPWFDAVDINIENVDVHHPPKE